MLGFLALFPERAAWRMFSRGDLNMGGSEEAEQGQAGGWDGGTSSAYPQTPLGDTALPEPRENHQAPAAARAAPGKALCGAGTATSVLPHSAAGEGARHPAPLKLALLL